jgi:hypothetical protein
MKGTHQKVLELLKKKKERMQLTSSDIIVLEVLFEQDNRKLQRSPLIDQAAERYQSSRLPEALEKKAAEIEAKTAINRLNQNGLMKEEKDEGVWNCEVKMRNICRLLNNHYTKKELGEEIVDFFDDLFENDVKDYVENAVEGFKTGINNAKISLGNFLKKVGSDLSDDKNEK